MIEGASPSGDGQKSGEMFAGWERCALVVTMPVHRSDEWRHVLKLVRLQCSHISRFEHSLSSACNEADEYTIPI